MSDLVVTVPRGLWSAWVGEGDLPGQEAQYESHFWAPQVFPLIEPGERVYIVAHGHYLNRGDAVLALLHLAGIPLFCLVKTLGGQPGHPLYLPRDVSPVPYRVTPQGVLHA